MQLNVINSELVHVAETVLARQLVHFNFDAIFVAVEPKPRIVMFLSIGEEIEIAAVVVAEADAEPGLVVNSGVGLIFVDG